MIQQKNKIQVAGITITHPEKILYPEIGLTKLQLVQYYEKIAKLILPHIIRRCLTLVRFPDGIKKSGFYQRHLDKGFPKGVYGKKVRGDRTPYIYIEDVTGLIALIQMGTIEIHPWESTIDHINHPDRMIIDLDPSEGTSWSTLLQGAKIIHALLKKLKLNSFIKTTGGKGLHIVLPIHKKITWEQLKNSAKHLADIAAEQYPDIFTTELPKKKRHKRIFVDYLRNTKEATAVAPYSARARKNASISMPIAWTEVTRLKSADQFTVENVFKRLTKNKTDPWKKLI